MIEKSLTCTFMILILGFGFLLRILWGKYFWIHDTLKRKKIFLSVLTGYWGSGKIGLCHLKRHWFPLFLYWNIIGYKSFFFSIKILEWQINRCNCISWQYLVIWSVVCDMKSFSCGNRILLQCCEYAW